ncbi:Uncharacterised protein [Catenibacterium mitsuokai]|nr:Uncharacterised protein [Catenibacterium mitsuokai]
MIYEAIIVSLRFVKDAGNTLKAVVCNEIINL